MNLTDLDLEAYKQYNERYYSTGSYKNVVHSLKVHDIVRINEHLSCDNGYEGHVGIVESLSGTNGYVSVMSYDSRNKRYWVCGFSECDLTKVPYTLKDINWELKEAYLDWLEREFFQFHCTDFTTKQLEKPSNDEILHNNVIYVDFDKN